MKVFILLTLIASSALAGSTTFTAYGRTCRMAMDSNGELITDDRYGAQRKATELALKQCYPYQVHRLTEFTYERKNDQCKSTNPHVLKETVSAEFTCAPL